MGVRRTSHHSVTCDAVLMDFEATRFLVIVVWSVTIDPALHSVSDGIRLFINAQLRMLIVILPLDAKHWQTTQTPSVFLCMLCCILGSRGGECVILHAGLVNIW